MAAKTAKTARHGNNVLEVVAIGSASAPAWNDQRVWSQEERRALVQRVSDGDRSALPELRAMFAAHPDAAARVFHPGRTERAAIARELSGEDDLLLPELMLAYYDGLQRDLEGEYPSALERVLCERIVAAQQVIHRLGMVVNATPAHDEMVTRAEDRLQRAVLTLAKVRRLLRPQIAQVNIAEAGAQQLNTATPDSSLR